MVFQPDFFFSNVKFFNVIDNFLLQAVFVKLIGLIQLFNFFPDPGFDFIYSYYLKFRNLLEVILYKLYTPGNI